jgi:hypothetical protein
VAEDLRVPWRPGCRACGEPAQAAGGRVPVHPGAATVEQDRTLVPGAYCSVDGSADGWR